MIHSNNKEKFYFEIDKNKDNLFYFNLKDKNGKVYLKSGSYTQKTNCQNGIKSVRINSKNRERFDINQNLNKKWSGVLKAENGRTIAFISYFNDKFKIEVFIEHLSQIINYAKFSDKTKRIPLWQINY